MRVAIVGAAGQLGAAVVHEFSQTSPRSDVIAFTRNDLDITDGAAIARAITDARPDTIVNCAAYNNVDAAEDRPVEALAVNAIAVRAMARIASDLGATLVHYSSDFVFDGRATVPYTETDRPNPRSFYAASKLMGEWFAADVPRHYVLRVESLFGRAPGGPAARGSVAGIYKGLLEGSEVKVFEDRTISPTLVTDAARATRMLVESGAEPGLYHCVNSGQCTWLDFARELARALEIASPKLVAIRMSDVAMRVERPQFCALSNAKLAAAGVTMPAWQDALSALLRQQSVR